MLQFPVEPHKKKAFFAMLMRLTRESEDFNALWTELNQVERARIERLNHTSTNTAEIHQNNGALQLLDDLEDAINRASIEVFGNKAS